MALLWNIVPLTMQWGNALSANIQGAVVMGLGGWALFDSMRFRSQSCSSFASPETHTHCCTPMISDERLFEPCCRFLVCLEHLEGGYFSTDCSQSYSSSPVRKSDWSSEGIFDRFTKAHCFTPVNSGERLFWPMLPLHCSSRESRWQLLFERVKQLWLERFLRCLEEGILLPSLVRRSGPLDFSESAVSLAVQ